MPVAKTTGKWADDKQCDGHERDRSDRIDPN
jgi:hypothetical protein